MYLVFFCSSLSGSFLLKVQDAKTIYVRYTLKASTWFSLNFSNYCQSCAVGAIPSCPIDSLACPALHVPINRAPSELCKMSLLTLQGAFKWTRTFASLWCWCIKRLPLPSLLLEIIQGLTTFYWINLSWIGLSTLLSDKASFTAIAVSFL